MLESLGLASTSTDALWAGGLCLLVLGLVVGWVSDSILGGVAFGLFGNSLIGVLGGGAGLLLLLRYGWIWVHPDVVSMSATSVAGAFAGVLLLAILRRVTS